MFKLLAAVTCMKRAAPSHDGIRPVVKKTVACAQALDELSSVHVVQVKKGPLAETSPMLNDISGVPTWDKVAPCLRSEQVASPGDLHTLIDVLDSCTSLLRWGWG